MVKRRNSSRYYAKRIDCGLQSWRNIAVNLSMTEIDAQAARERYIDQLRQARLLRLVRESQASQPAKQPAEPKSLLARLRAALFVQRPDRAWR
jgi:hypothetical protein